MNIIAAANSKGGAGKSILIIAIASALHHAGKRVRIIDLDPQETLARWFTDETENLYPKIPRKELLIERGHFSNHPEENVARAYRHLVEAAKEPNYDYILIDTKGEASIMSAMAMCAADYVLCPTNGSSTEFEPIIATFLSYQSALAQLDKATDPRKNFRIVFTRQSAVQAASIIESKTALKKNFACIDGLAQSAAYNDAHLKHTTIGRLLERARTAEAQSDKASIRKNARRLIERYEKALRNAADIIAQIESKETCNVAS